LTRKVNKLEQLRKAGLVFTLRRPPDNPATPCAKKSEFELFWGVKVGGKEVWVGLIQFQITFWGPEKNIEGNYLVCSLKCSRSYFEV